MNTIFVGYILNGKKTEVTVIKGANSLSDAYRMADKYCILKNSYGNNCSVAKVEPRMIGRI